VPQAVKVAGRALAVVVVVVAGAALLAGVVVPRLAGATPYTVLTGSMAPALPPGTLVVVRPSSSVAIGDVITYQRSAGAPVVTHRVVGAGVTTDGQVVYTTQGDANDVADAGAVHADQVRGVVWYHVPFLGRAESVLTGAQRQAAAVAVAAALVVYAAWQLWLARRERAAARRPRHRAPAAGPAVGRAVAGKPG